MGISVASAARDAGIAGMEFLRGIPGTVGGAVRMNAGAYGREAADILIECTVVLRDGRVESWKAEDLRSEEHTSELQSLMRISYAVFCLKKKNTELFSNYIDEHKMHHCHTAR